MVKLACVVVYLIQLIDQVFRVRSWVWNDCVANMRNDLAEH